MKRRDLLAWLLALGMPLARGQAADGLPRIGYLATTSPGTDAPRIEALRRGLRDLGYEENKSIVIVYRYAEGRLERLDALAADLLRERVRLIVTGGTPGIQAARRATRTIPIVMASSADPIGSGFIASFARPGGNVTGATSINMELAHKRLEMIREILPGAARVAFLAHGGDPAHHAFLQQTEQASGRFGMQVVPVIVRSVAEAERALGSKGKFDALIVQPIFSSHYREVAALALKKQLPSFSDLKEYAEAGGLVSYGPPIGDSYYAAASYVDRILKGAKPADLPVTQPRRFETIVNLRTAKALDIEIPRTVVLRADQVIE